MLEEALPAEQALEKAGVAKLGFDFTFGSIGYDQHSLVRAVREVAAEHGFAEIGEGYVVVDTSKWKVEER